MTGRPPKVDYARARKMRAEGMTLQAIGDEFGVSRERIRQIVGSPRINEVRSCEHCGVEFETDLHVQRFCSTNCQKYAWAARSQPKCPECGAAMGRRAKRCYECTRAAEDRRRGERWDRIEELWHQGVPTKEIAREVGLKNANVLGVTIARMAHAGRPLPARRKGWRGHGVPTGPPPKFTGPPRSNAEARYRFRCALIAGRIKRADACERCGQEGHVQGHHFDYSKPLEVEWLCRSCHMTEHGKTPVAC